MYRLIDDLLAYFCGSNGGPLDDVAVDLRPILEGLAALSALRRSGLGRCELSWRCRR